MRHELARTAAALVIILTAAACSNGATPTTASSGTADGAATTAAAAGSSAVSAAAQPETATAARAVAEQYFGLYAAGQYADSYDLLAPSAQQAVSRATWTAVHEGCPSAARGLAYQVSKATLTGTTAVVTVSLSGVASAIGSKSVALKYSAGRWGLLLDDPGIFRHGSVQADVAAARAAGYCAKS